MPTLFRNVGVGNRDFAAWIEDGGRALTFTIDSEPQQRKQLTSWNDEDSEKEALALFAKWLKDNYGITAPWLIEAERSASLTEQIARLGQLHAKGTLTDEEFSRAKQKLLG